MQKREGPMKEVSVMGIDLAKNIFQLHGAPDLDCDLFGFGQ